MTIEPVILEPGVVLRQVSLLDAPALTRAYRRNREHLAPFEPIRDEEFYTEAGQAELLRVVEAARSGRRGERWVLAGTDGEVYGSVSLSAMEHGAFRNGRLGYWVDGAMAGRGLGTAAVGRVCEVAAGEFGLHRLEAGTLVDNTASQRVLTKCGFEEFGLAKLYLKIAGQWRDHRMFQRILD